MMSRDAALPWIAAGAAVQGTSHQKLGLPCQDFQEFKLLHAGCLIAALADGAGTAGLADLGARCAVEEALASLSTHLEADLPETVEDWECLIWAAFEQAQAALQRLAWEMDVPERELATTLACAVAWEGGLAAGQLGDGAIVSQNPAGEMELVTSFQRGEYANETFFLTQEDALDLVSIQVHSGPVRALAMMSDGLTRLAFKMPSGEPHAPFFQPLFAFAAAQGQNGQAKQQLAAFLASERVCSRTDDDKSLIVAVSPGIEPDGIVKDTGRQASPDEGDPPHAELSA
jgi:hypothetical protein